jgi:hypothetical protein
MRRRTRQEYTRTSALSYRAVTHLRHGTASTRGVADDTTDTLVQSGVKVNSLPEEAWAVVNHQIATQSLYSVCIAEIRVDHPCHLLGTCEQLCHCGQRT